MYRYMAASILFCVPEWGATTLFCQLDETGFVNKTMLTVYKRHQNLITELEIGAVGTDCSRRTSW
jgi:hypothetical protein